MNTVTRKFAAAVVAVAVVGASLMGAQSASAAPHHKKHTRSSIVHALSTAPGYGPVLTGAASCQADGSYMVVWTANAYPYDFTITAPRDLAPTGSGYVVGPFLRHIATTSVTELRVAGGSLAAGITVSFNRTISGTAYSWPLSGTITLDGACIPTP